MKKMGFFCFLSFLVLAIIFHQNLLNTLASWSLQTYSTSRWGKPLEYKNLVLSGNRLVIDQPRFEKGSFTSAERMTLIFHFNWWSGPFHVDIEIENPHFHLQTLSSSKWANWEKLLRREGKWVKLHPSFHIKTGLVTWEFADVSHQLRFDLEANSHEGGVIKLYFHPNDFKTDYLILQASRAKEGMEVNCRCEQMSCSALFSLTRFLGFNTLPWSVASGFLQGELSAIFPGSQRPYLEGEILIEQLKLSHAEKSLNGKIEQALLKLEKNQSTHAWGDDKVSSFIGKLDFLKPASIEYTSPFQNWSIDQIEGSIQLNNLETASIDLRGYSKNSNGFDSSSSFHWFLEGKSNLNVLRTLNMDFNLFCSSSELPDGKIHFSFHQPSKGYKHLEVQLEKVSYAECDFLQNLLATYWPVFNQIKLENGELNASIEAEMTNGEFGELHIKHFEAFHLSSYLKPWNAKCYFNRTEGHGKVDLRKEDLLQSLHAGLKLQDGEIQFDGIQPHLPLTDIQAHLLIQQGHIEHSLITLQLAGLKGKMDVEWGEHKQLLTFKLDGFVQDLAELFPSFLQEGLAKNFEHNRLMVLANVKRQNQQIELGGTLHIQRLNGEQMDLFHFGCELKKNQLDPASKYVPIGWFSAQHIPLEKFLSPFIFRKGNTLRLSGEAEFKGSFDDQYLTIKYDAENLKIENDDFCIKSEHLSSRIPGELIGSHQVDLSNYSHHGTLPIQNATYFEKNSGLIFQDIKGIVLFKDQVIRIDPLEAYSEGVYFAGELELDYSDPTPKAFKLSIHCPTFSGSVSQIQHLLAHLDQPSLLHKIPLEGEVEAKEEGIKLNFDFLSKDYRLQADVHAMMTNGSLSFESSDLALKGIYMDIGYSHQQQLLEFSDIQGALLIGKPRRVEEYLFLGNHIRLLQIAQPDIEFDIAVKDHEHELLRCAGYTKKEDEDARSLYLYQDISHISSIYPQVWECRVNGWSQIEKFEFLSQFDLTLLLNDLQRFRQTGLLFLSHGFIDKISEWMPCEGQGSLALSRQSDQSYLYDLEIAKIKLGDQTEHHGFLKGSKLDKKWILDQLQWDDANVYAELHQALDKWKISFLGLNIGQHLLLGIDGDFTPEEALLRAKINFCEVNLAKLDRYKTLQSFITKWWPKGHLKATGEIEWDCQSSSLLDGFKASLLAEVDELSIRDYSLQMSHPFHIVFQGSQSCCLQDVLLELSPHKSQATIELQEFDYIPNQNSLNSLQLVFKIPSQQLDAIGQEIFHYFPDLLDPELKASLVSVKQEGLLQGKLIVENNRTNQKSLRLMLEDGVYHFKKREVDLKQFELHILENTLQFSTMAQEERCPFRVVGQLDWPSCQFGQCTLMNLDVSQTSDQPLLIKWENHPQRGCIFHSMQGEFSGCHFQLEENHDDFLGNGWTGLQGQVAVDFNLLCPLLTKRMAEAIQKLKLGSSYSLVGRFWMNPDLGDAFLDTVSCKGNLISEEAILKGFQVQKIRADLQYVPGRLDVQNLMIQDPAGSVKIGDLIATFDYPKDKWTLYVPRLTVKNLRPFLLRDRENPQAQPNAKFRSLYVKRIDLQDFSGQLDNLQTWQGQGYLHFLNPSRKNMTHPLLAIPAEIILRLGLDPQVLNPVTGMIYFRLQGERFYLTRFKDVFSEGRGSKFYLAQAQDPSWMDLNGNLSVQVRMKQYNLIFKIAELFTVSVQGNIKKPRYSLQKHSKMPHKD